MSKRPELPSNLDLYQLPLVQVALEHGTKGLEQRLQYTLGRVGLVHNELIQASIQLGLDLHKNDTRTYEPYNNHILRVPLRLIEDLGVTDPVTVAASPLHDSLEDHVKELIRRFLDLEELPSDPHTLRKLGHKALGVFASQYDDASELPDIVLAVSNPILEPGSDKIKEYVGHVRPLVSQGPPKPQKTKWADFLDNVDVPPGLEDPEKRKKLDKKQIGVYKHMAEGLRQPDSQITDIPRDRTLILLEKRYVEARERLGYDDDSGLPPINSLRPT